MIIDGRRILDDRNCASGFGGGSGITTEDDKAIIPHLSGKLEDTLFY